MERTREQNLDRIVSNEVFYCASTLVYELAQDEKHMEELMPVLSQYPEFEDNETQGECEGCDEVTTLDGNTAYTQQGKTLGVCESCFDPEPEEALEHWIVSDWLATELKGQGEMVIDDFMGLTIWGRTCSGQAISLDYVIGQIYDKLHNKAA